MKKSFNSKNLAVQIQSLISLGKSDLVMDLLKIDELKNLLPNILDILKRKNGKDTDYNQTKIYSKTGVDQDLLKKLEKILKIDTGTQTESAKMIIDENMGAGIRIKKGDKLVDATLETMLKNSLS